MLNNHSETVLAVDVGEARVGLAISESGSPMGLPLKTLKRQNAIEEILSIAISRSVSIILLGWPLQLDGRATRATRRVEVFEEKLKNALKQLDKNISIKHIDERLSTVHAHNLLTEAHVFGKKRREVVDQVAAVNILNTYLTQRRLQDSYPLTD